MVYCISEEQKAVKKYFFPLSVHKIDLEIYSLKKTTLLDAFLIMSQDSSYSYSVKLTLLNRYIFYIPSCFISFFAI